MAYGPFFLPDLSYPFTCPCTCVSTYRPFTGPCTCNGPCTCSPFTGPCTCVCVVRVFAQFSMACVRFRPRRASPTFFPCPRTARSRVRVRVCASYVVLPSFPWRASGSVHDGRRPLFSRVHVQPVHGSVYVCASYVVLPRFPCAHVTFRPRRGSAPFSPCPRTARSRVRVRVCASYVVLPSFPWRASTSVHDGRRPLFSCVPVYESLYVVLPNFPWCASSSVHHSCPCLL